MGLNDRMKDRLIQQVLERRLKQTDQFNRPEEHLVTGNTVAAVDESHCRFDAHPVYQQMRVINAGAVRMGIANPFFKQHDGVAGATTQISGRHCINFSNYNYLGLSGHPEVSLAAKEAIDRYGTSVSASRVVSGERPVHRELERAIADVYGVDDAIVFVSGHATNVSTISQLFGPKDLILHDALAHNSIMQGIQLSGAARLPFPHNDVGALERLLHEHRYRFERVLVVLEGVYSMDGDFPDLPRCVELKQRYGAFLMVDEAHSFGVMGATGRGIREHFGLSGTDVDIWMGTLSKTLAGCGGYIAGETALIEHLKFMASGFLYSVGMAPPLAAASLAALRIMLREPQRVRALQHNGQRFLQLAQQAGIDTGTSSGLAVIPAIIGSSFKASRLSAALLEQGINVQPIIYPAVPEKTARLRFFISCDHMEEQLQIAIKALHKLLASL